MSGHFTPGELTSFKRGGWRGLAQGATPMARLTDKERLRRIAQIIEQAANSTPRAERLAASGPPDGLRAVTLTQDEIREVYALAMRLDTVRPAVVR